MLPDVIGLRHDKSGICLQGLQRFFFIDLVYGETRVRDYIVTRHNPGDEVERISEFQPLTGEIYAEPQEASIYPAKHYLTEGDKLKDAIVDIEKELEDRIALFKSEGKLIEAQRIEQRTRYDIEMLKEVGYCSGIERRDSATGRSGCWRTESRVPCR